MAEARETLERKAREREALRDRIRPLTFHAAHPGRANGGTAGTGAGAPPLPQAGKPTHGGDIDAAALARELEGALEGEVRFDAGHRALYSTDGSHYRQVPIGVVTPQTKDDVVSTVEACRRHGAPVLARGGGHQPRRAVLQRGGGARLLPPHEQRAGGGRRAEASPGSSPACVLDDLRKAASAYGLTFGPDPATHNHCTLGGMIGNNSCGIHSVMAAVAHGPPHVGQRAPAGGAHLRRRPLLDRPHLGRGVRADPRRRAGARPRSTRRSATLRDEYADEIRRRYPDIPRRVSGYNLDDLLPENGFHVARSLVGSECTCALWLEAEVHLIPQPEGEHAGGGGLPRRVHGGRQVPGRDGVPAHGAGGHRRAPHPLYEDEGPEREGRAPPPRGHGLPAGPVRGRRQGRGEPERPGVHARHGEGGKTPPSPCARTTTRTRRRRSGRCGSRGWAPPPTCPASPTPTPAGKTRRWSRSGWATTCGSFAELLDDYEYDCAFYGHFGQGLLHTRIDFELPAPPGRRAATCASCARRPSWCSSTAAPSRGSTATARPRGALLSKMFGPAAHEGHAHLQGRVGPRLAHEPGQGRGRLPARTRTWPRARTGRPRGGDLVRSSPTTAGASPPPPTAAWGWASAAARAAARCAPATWSPARRCTRPGAARACSTR